METVILSDGIFTNLVENSIDLDRKYIAVYLRPPREISR
jgi:hypothetical protein